MVDTLLLMKASKRGDRATREFIVSQTITFFNLHRCLQFCFKPRQCDSMIDSKAFTFVSIATKKAIKATKTAQLFTATGSREAGIGDAYIYEVDDKQYRVEVVDKHRADGRHYVPRCTAGSNGPNAAPPDLDATNGKLLVRRFSKRGAGQIKSPPGWLCHADTSDADIRRGQMNHMQAGLRWQEELLEQWRSPANQEADRQRVHDTLVELGQNQQARDGIRQTLTAANEQQQQQEEEEATTGNAAAAATSAVTPAAAPAPAAVEVVMQSAPAAAAPGAAPDAPAVVGQAGAAVTAASSRQQAPTAAPAAAAAPAASSRQQQQEPPTAAAAAAAGATSRPQGQGATAVKPAAASKPAKAAAGNNSILKYFAKQPALAQ